MACAVDNSPTHIRYTKSILRGLGFATAPSGALLVLPDGSALRTGTVSIRPSRWVHQVSGPPDSPHL